MNLVIHVVGSILWKLITIEVSMRRLNLVGQRFGKLTVVADNGSRYGKSLWACQCDCGKMRDVPAGHLRNSHTTSCGCYKAESSYRHGFLGTRLYRVYSCMIGRCYRSSQVGYHNYGGRGIEVCKGWKDDRKTFFSWALNNGYTDDLELDRIDNNGNYRPSNCRFVTHKQNSRNKRNAILIEHDGQTKCLSEWADAIGMAYTAMYYRHKRGWTMGKIIRSCC